MIILSVYTTLTLVQYRLKNFHLTKYIFSKLITFMLSIPAKKELNILAQYSCTYNLKIIFFIQCVKIQICVDLSSLYSPGLGCRTYLWDKGSI